MTNPLLPLRWASKKHQNESWALMHDKAIGNADPSEISAASVVATMLNAWLAYADRHASTYESPIGDDGVLGPAWAGMGVALRKLLNGDCGRLDCGTIDGAIVTALRLNGFDEDGREA